MAAQERHLIPLNLTRRTGIKSHYYHWIEWARRGGQRSARRGATRPHRSHRWRAHERHLVPLNLTRRAGIQQWVQKPLRRWAVRRTL